MHVGYWDTYYLHAWMLAQHSQVTCGGVVVAVVTAPWKQGA